MGSQNYVTFKILYTCPGDGTPHQRQIIVTQDIPATERGPYTDQILAIPNLGWRKTWIIRLPGTVTIAPDATPGEIELGIVGQALDQELTERKAEQAAAAARQLDGARELLAWARGSDPDPKNLRDMSLVRRFGNPVPDGPHIEYNKLCIYDRNGLAQMIGEEETAEIEAALTEILDRQQAAAEADKTQREAEAAEAAERRARDKAEKAAAAKRRHAEVIAWAKVHGSERLQDMLALGRDGWPLYLHERLARDFPGAELDNDGIDSDCMTPSAESLATCWKVAARMVEIGVVEDKETALRDLLDVKILELDGERMEVIYWGSYRPGSDPSWGEKTIRWVIEETRCPIDRADSEDEGY